MCVHMCVSNLREAQIDRHRLRNVEETAFLTDHEHKPIKRLQRKWEVHYTHLFTDVKQDQDDPMRSNKHKTECFLRQQVNPNGGGVRLCVYINKNKEL